MAKTKFKIRTKFVFSGRVQIKAHNRQKAEAEVEKNTAALLGKVDAHSDDIVTGDLPIHGDTVINRKEQREEGGV